MKDISGEKFGLLTAIEPVGTNKYHKVMQFYPIFRAIMEVDNL